MSRFRCVLGDACLCPHVDHTEDECFDVDMAEAWEAEQCQISHPDHDCNVDHEASRASATEPATEPKEQAE